MILFKGGENLFHDGGAHQGGAGADAEAPAVFVYGGEFTVIEVEDVAVLPQKHLFLLLKVLGINSGDFLSACHNGLKLYVAVLYYCFFVQFYHHRHI